MRFGILGETFALDPAGRAVGLGGPGRRALFALLLLDAGRLVPVARMVDGLYGEEPPVGVVNAVQSQVSRLRSALGPVIERHPGGYLLAVDPAEVDVHRFTRLAAQGREAVLAEEYERAAGVLSAALGLWRGPALADVRDAPFAVAQVTRLEDARAVAVENRVAAGLALGEHAALVPDLREIVAEYPLRERPVAQLMRALAGSGRQAEALEAYESARRALAETLGADPGAELAEAHLAVLRGDVSRETASGAADVSRETSPGARRVDVSRETANLVDPPVSRETAHPAGPPVSRETSLPAQLTSFVGRSRELGWVAERLAESRLVTLTGPGGAGKTRLSIEAAARCAGEVCFVPLAGVTDANDVPQAVLGALGLREAGLMPTAAPVQDPLDRMVAAMAHRSMLLVLDNCEHVVEAAATLVAGLLAGCPALRVLTTSREALGITGEALCPVPPLGLPPAAEAGAVDGFPAVRLFVERATAVRPDFVLADEREAVLRICAALDGLPLAIELAAARLRSLSGREIADRLGGLPDDQDQDGDRADEPADDRFRLLSRGSRTAQPRQRTLRGVVDWSWDLLTPAERAVLRRASVFAGGWTLEDAEVVCADAAPDAEGVAAPDVLDVIDALVDKSLVVALRTPGGRSRYRLLETIRAYAGERLTESGEARRVRRAHIACFHGLAVTAEPRLRRAGQLDWLARLTADHDNLTAALHRAVRDGDHASGLRMLAALTTYWMLRGVRYEGVGPARRLLDAVGDTPPPGLSEEYALCVITAAPAARGERELAARLATAHRIIRGGPGRYPVVWLLWAAISGVPDTATYTAYQSTLSALEPWFEGLSRIGEGYQAWLVRGEADAADRAFTGALAGFRAIGDRWGSALALTHLAGFVLFTGDLERAVELVDEALVIAEEMGATENRAELLCHRGQCRARAGDLEAARADFTRAVALARAAGAPEVQATAHVGLAECARQAGELEAAGALCGTALSECLPEWFSGEATRGEVALCRGRIALAAGDPDRALEYYRDSLSAPMNARSRAFTAAVAEALAELALRRAAPARAAELLGLARALRGMDVLDDPETAAVRAAARAALGAPAFDAAHEAGAAPRGDAATTALREALTTG